MTNRFKKNKIFFVSQQNIFNEYNQNQCNFKNENIAEKYQLTEYSNEIKIIKFNFTSGNHNFINNFINYLIKEQLLNQDDINEINRIKRMYQKNNAAFYVKCFKTLMEYFETDSVETIYNNFILQIDKHDKIHYYNENSNEIEIKGFKELKDEIARNLNQFDYAIVIIPGHLRFIHDDIYSFFTDDSSKEFIEKYYIKENFEKMLNVFQNFNNNRFLKNIARIVKNSKASCCTLKKDEEVYIESKTRFKDRFRVITKQGLISYATKSQLSILSQKEQTQDLKNLYIDARKTLLLNQEKEGYPILFTIRVLEKQSSFIYGETSDKLKMYIPKKIIPSMHFSKYKEGDTVWISIPAWYFEKFNKLQ